MGEGAIMNAILEPRDGTQADCGHAIDVGAYGTDPDTGRTRCFACCAKIESDRMTATGRAVLYLASYATNDGRRWRITDWPANLNFPAYEVIHTIGRGFNGCSYQVTTGRFKGPDGASWGFRNAGDNDIARCMRLKDPRRRPGITKKRHIRHF
jgi:hypothetical protein